MTQEERNLAYSWFEEVWNKGRRDAIPELMARDAVLHEGGADSVGPDGFYPFFDRFHAALSEIHVTVHDTVAEGDRICTRWSFTGKHTGSGLGIPPTGKTVHVTGMGIIRVAGGKLVEGWQNWDMLGMLNQIQDAAKPRTYVAVA